MLILFYYPVPFLSTTIISIFVLIYWISFFINCIKYLILQKKNYYKKKTQRSFCTLPSTSHFPVQHYHQRQQQHQYCSFIANQLLLLTMSIFSFHLLNKNRFKISMEILKREHKLSHLGDLNVYLIINHFVFNLKLFFSTC